MDAYCINTINQTQAKLTTTTKQLCNHNLDYCAGYQNVGLCYNATNMILHVDWDASFLVTSEAKSTNAGYFLLQNCTSSLETIKPNALILVKCGTLKHVVTSAAECETEGFFMMQKE